MAALAVCLGVMPASGHPMSSRLTELTDELLGSIVMLLETHREKSALILLYSCVDILGALDTDDGEATRKSFVRLGRQVHDTDDQLGLQRSRTVQRSLWAAARLDAPDAFDEAREGTPVLLRHLSCVLSRGECPGRVVHRARPHALAGLPRWRKTNPWWIRSRVRSWRNESSGT